MKLACATGAFDRAMLRGDLTQLEFIDVCARELACDGIVLDVRHFPRTDDDYLAQTKKLATDLGLDIAAVSDDAFFEAGREAMTATLGVAQRIGAPIVSGSLARETACSWSEQLVRLNVATGLAKERNVTLGVRNAPETFAAGAHECKRALKEADSAWLRLGLETAAYASDDFSGLRDRCVLLWQPAGDLATPAGSPILNLARNFRGYAALDQADGAAPLAAMQSALRKFRNALATAELNRT